MALGEKLFYLRKKQGMSQEQLAAKVKVSRQAISKWELGTSIPDTENILQLTKIFNVTADFLLNDEIDIPVAAVIDEDDKDVSQSLLEKEVKEDSERLAMKAYPKRTLLNQFQNCV